MTDSFDRPPAPVAKLRREATALAGGLADLSQRASVYHHLYDHSGGNHSFPLLAAHGALWASGYFKAGMRCGAIVAAGYRALGHDHIELMRSLKKFADDFRDINRRVCVETYFIYHLTGSRELSSFADTYVQSDLREQMQRCHTARVAGRSLSNREKRALFGAFFLWEQENIVGPSIRKAFDGFRWTPIKYLAIRPTIRFAYFPRSHPLRFANFNETVERVEKGFRAFDLAQNVGWQAVERALGFYEIMPQEFLTDSRNFFDNIFSRTAISQAAV